MRLIALSGALLLAGCGVAADPEKGAAVLQCDGKSNLGDPAAQLGPETRFYRIDGTKRLFETWDENAGGFVKVDGSFFISPATISFTTMSGEQDGSYSYSFNRAKGSVTDNYTNKFGSVVFEGTCKPVKSPQEAPKKF